MCCIDWGGAKSGATICKYFIIKNYTAGNAEL
jgi:hypothetical protein